MTNDATRRNIDKQRRGADGKVIAASPMKAIVEALNEGYQAIRAHNPEVPNAVLVVGTSSKTKHGHFSSDSWALSDKRVHEIMLSGESLQRDALDVFGTLLHEAAHALAHTRGIQDTSRQGRWHNAKFKALANEVGIVVEQHPSIGWSLTSVPPATRKLYQPEITKLRRALKTYRVPTYKADPKPRVKRTIKLKTASGRVLNVKIAEHEQGPIFDAVTGELFEEAED